VAPRKGPGKGRLLLMLSAALGALYAGGLFYEIDFAAAGCCGLTWPTPDPGAVERAMAAADPKGLNAAVQGQAALSVLSARPAEAVAWLRLAYADRLANGRLTEAGAHAVDMSYLTQPYAGSQTPWRLGFALDNWSRLSAEGRKDALREVETARNDFERWPAVQARSRQVRDQSGRMTAALLGLIG
jgi:hypothetical protein